MTTKDEYELFILMEDFAGEKRYARYKMFFFFFIEDIHSKFQIDVGGYSGNAGLLLLFGLL